MRIVQLESNINQCATEASHTLHQNGILLYPTDTLYGLGADAFSNEVVAKIYAIKGRDQNKPIHCIVSDMDMANEYAEINDIAQRIAKKFLPGPLTLVLKKRMHLNTGIAKGMNTIGIRIPNNTFCKELAKSFGKPYTTTSANLANMKPELNVTKILEQFGASASKIDLVIDAGNISDSKPSTVVDVTSGTPIVLREGAISTKEIMEAA